MLEITSTANERIRYLKSLQQAAVRRRDGLFLAEGEHLVQEALQNNCPIEGIYVQKDHLARYAYLLQGREDITLLSPQALQACCETRTPQGIVALVRGAAQPFTAPPDGTLAVAMDGVQDPGNVGTILRTAAAVGASFVLAGPGCADYFAGKTVRASMGALFRLALYRCDDLPAAMQACNAAGWHSACAHLQGGDFYARTPHEKNLLLVGSEGQGVSAAASAACSARYRLPMAPGSESLNAAVAAGIMLYDLWRNR